MNVVLQILIVALWIYFLLMLARLVLDWVMVFARSYRPQGPALVLFEIVYSATDPPLRALRRVIPPLRIGSVALDLGFIIVIIGIQILITLLTSLLR